MTNYVIEVTIYNISLYKPIKNVCRVTNVILICIFSTVSMGTDPIFNNIYRNILYLFDNIYDTYINRSIYNFT
jgi:hypothetical protein